MRVGEFDVFISYRVATEKDVAEKIVFRLESQKPSGLKCWWDNKDLEGGVSWMDGVCGGLRKATHFVPLLSRQSLNPIKSLNSDAMDNMLMEIETAVDMMDTNPGFVIPLCIGEYIRVEEDSRLALLKFGEFDASQFPNVTSSTCSNRTIRQTIERLFSIQCIHVDPQDMTCPISRLTSLIVGSQLTTVASSLAASEATDSVSNLRSGSASGSDASGSGSASPTPSPSNGSTATGTGTDAGAGTDAGWHNKSDSDSDDEGTAFEIDGMECVYSHHDHHHDHHHHANNTNDNSTFATHGSGTHTNHTSKLGATIRNVLTLLLDPHSVVNLTVDERADIVSLTNQITHTLTASGSVQSVTNGVMLSEEKHEGSVPNASNEMMVGIKQRSPQ